MAKKISDETLAKSLPRKPPDVWEREARRVLLVEMSRAEKEPEDLARKLKESGFGVASSKALALRISRGAFSFAFALRLLKAMGVQSLDISYVKNHKR